ncbi:MAG: 4a-hydroxytetrahydrobiopterin dehydratase [Gemmatimonadaceae bacterium]
MPRERLSDIAIQRELGSLTGWARKNDTLVKSYNFRSFPQGIAFVNRVADLAENMNHHPDIDIRYTKVLCALSTHDAGGITEYDVNLARGIERIYEDIRS